ncbi:RHO alpha subunit C-terminal catalytic domain-containing protein [Azospirillum sp.]|uniref:RHO alpha subunit C-terminal catalytic domain-containing protein n=1 Tax=Azospirillum sp. TaxID=34012 RepID=UPI00260A6414|nr:RHO alpha subunit C-terminal catalytic domain-containing protein [Azospirillum sp.]
MIRSCFQAIIPDIGEFLPHHHFWTEAAFAEERARVFGHCWLYMGVFDATSALSADMAGLRFEILRQGETLRGICRDGDRVHPLEVDRCGALVFARVAREGGPTLAQHLHPYTERLAAMSANCVNPEPPVGIPFQANWKALIENTMDDFHGSTVHPQTIHPAVHPDWQTHLTTERHGANSDSRWRLADGTADWWTKLDAKLKMAKFAEEPFYRHTFIFPNFYLASFYGAVVIPHRVDPVAPDASVLRWQLFLPTTRLETARDRAFHRSTASYLIASAADVIDEDRPVCEAVQQGRPGILGNGVYGRRERRILDFHQAMLRQLAATA